MLRNADGVSVVREFPNQDLEQDGAFVAQHSADVVLFKIDDVLWRSDGTPFGTFELGQAAHVDSLDDCTSDDAQEGCPCEAQEDCAMFTDAFGNEARLGCSSFFTPSGDQARECRSQRLDFDRFTSAAVRVDDVTYLLAVVGTIPDDLPVFARVAPDGKSYSVVGRRGGRYEFQDAFFALAGADLYAVKNNNLFRLALPGSPSAQPTESLTDRVRVRANDELGAVVIDTNKVLLSDSANAFFFDATDDTVTVLRNKVGFDTGELVQNGFNAVHFRHSYVYARSLEQKGELVVSDGKVSFACELRVALRQTHTSNRQSILQMLHASPTWRNTRECFARLTAV